MESVFCLSRVRSLVSVLTEVVSLRRSVWVSDTLLIFSNILFIFCSIVNTLSGSVLSSMSFSFAFCVRSSRGWFQFRQLTVTVGKSRSGPDTSCSFWHYVS